ncbi:MAG: branched-chain amino acid aminotransferase [Methylobacterium sp.]|uniref:branched-chain amino acid aminotransferase n=1 Tax=Rhabdaerophilum sp. TaxID=2717341 RepID=UPI0038D40470|nr:branched-chain amino acid aminotransferase [Methylobacterium sp.]MCA3652065.1 branched-chain amino acid aminotransferase [Methylobacterium sp.]MCA4923178.1 branched-chain amino acid aminotransferase [Methylobacterium sp.]
MMAWSETWTFFEGRWLEGNPPLMGPRSHAFWLASTVFDGARVFEGVYPDLDRHADRLVRSASNLGLKAGVSPEEIVALTKEGTKKFAADAPLYVKPMVWAEGEGASTILPNPDDCRFALCLFVAPMPEPRGMSLTLSPFRRPSLECMPTDAKAGCLYPNNARCLSEAKSRGFDNCLVRDLLGNIAETATANIFMVKDGVVFTPAPNGAFLNGITRQRVIQLMRDTGVQVVEQALSYEDFARADEVFISGNYSKVMPVTRLDGREYQAGPAYRKARELYWEFAHAA